VLRTAQRLLLRAGFRVSTAESGFDALALLSAAANDVAVIVTDVMMPGLSGPQLVAERRALGDTRPVIYISGYTGEALPAALLPEAGAVLISKPFTSSQLVGAINTALGREGTARHR
jgi:two-component system cell cycle sensor histidine kinase/response regulator CckA